MGDNACGIKDNGVAYCWGNNADSQVGDGTTTNRNVPTLVTGGHLFEQLSPGYYSTCGLKTGDIYCWGYNAWGLVGDGTTTSRTAPTKIVNP